MKKGFDFTLMVAGEWSNFWVEPLRSWVSPSQPRSKLTLSLSLMAR